MIAWCQRSGRETAAAIIVLTGLVIATGRLTTGCSMFTAQNAKSVLDVAAIACAIAHAESDDATIATVCGIADVLIPDLKTILAEQRKQIAKAKRAGVCIDAGSQ